MSRTDERNEGKVLLQIENLSLGYETAEESLEALKGVDLDVRAGEITLLFGETGSGKSSLAKAVLGLLPKNARLGLESSIRWQGEEQLSFTRSWRKEVLGKQITTVMQNPLLAMNPIMRIGRQVGEAVAIKNNVSGSQRRAKVLMLFEKVNLEDPMRVLRSYPHQVSVGQLQRAAIAMALAPRPKLILADEPFSSVDTLNKQALADLFTRLRAEIGCAFLVISHDLGLCRRLGAHQWYIMHEGQIDSRGRGEVLDHLHPSGSYSEQLVQSYHRLRSAQGPDEADSPRSIIAVKGVSHTYRSVRSPAEVPSHPALHQVSFSVARGEFFGIVGASGSGKSTLAKIMGGLLSGYQGSVLLDARQVQDRVSEDPRQFFGFVQYLMQDAATALPPLRRVDKILLETLQAFQPSLHRKERRQRLEELMGEVQLTPGHLLKYRNQLSGGEKQRICIARALAAAPSILILDESLTSLDKGVQWRMVQLLQKLRSASGITILLVAHDLALIRHCCDRVLVLREGKVEILTTPQQLTKEHENAYLRALAAAGG